MRRRARSDPIEHWLIREAFLPFITPRLINRGQVNSAICYFNDVSSYEINAPDLDEENICRTSFNPVRSIIFHFYIVVEYLVGTKKTNTVYYISFPCIFYIKKLFIIWVF